MYSNNISVPHSYFKKAKKEYRNWLMALFREIIQNSMDAGSKNIDFNLEKNDEHFILTCRDNGSGMDENILVNTLLCLGGSYKDNSDAIGGFGYAKTLLFFAHEHYLIRTQDNVVEGVGGNYDISKTENYIDGTEIVLTIHEKEEFGNTYRFEFEDAIHEIMAYSNLKGIKVTFDNEIVKDNAYKFDYEYETTIGKVIFKDIDSGYSSKLWVRINGLAMFQHHVWSESKSCFLGIIELDQKPTEVLTTNRDSLKGQSEVEFNQIFASLQDERSALKTHKVMNWTLNPFDFLIENNNSNEETVEGTQSVTAYANNKTSEKSQNTSEEAQSNTFEKPPERPEFSPFQKLVTASEREKEQIEKLFQDLEEEHLPMNFKIQKDDSCSLKNFQIKKELMKKNNIKMAHNWNKVIYSILASIEGARFYDVHGLETSYKGQQGIFYLYSRPIYVGFIFGDGAKAVNSSNKDSINIIINPALVKFNTKISKLYDIGFHETAHIFNENHDENFCSMEMKIKWGFRDFWKVTEIKKYGEILF